MSQMQAEQAVVAERYMWAPQPGPQADATSCPCDEIFFGGARGGSKTDTLLGRQMAGAQRHGRAWNGLVIRKLYKHFAEIRRRIGELHSLGLPAVLSGGENQPNYWRFRNGATVQLQAVQRLEQLDPYQGQQFTEISIDECCQFGFLADMIDRLKGCLRSPHGVPCAMFLTGNPGGPGHSVARQRYIAPHREGKRVIKDPVTGERRVFIPSRVQDNQILTAADPKYVARLQAIRDPRLRAAWLEGDWDVLLGGFFDGWWDASVHVVPPFQPRPPRGWTRLMGLDWGSARPFSVGWYCIADGQPVKGYPWVFPRGAIIHYAEWYGCVKDSPNEGLRLDSATVAQEILARERRRNEGDLLFDRIADPACWQQQDGPSIAEKLANAKVVCRRGDNSRVAGWDEFCRRLEGRDGTPMFYATSNCAEWLRTVPVLERDERDWEDVDTDQEDHAADQTRLVLMSRPIIQPTRREKHQIAERQAEAIRPLDAEAGY